MRCLPLLAALFLAPATARAQPAGADQYGDPLPPGAVARLGSVRFLHTGAVHGIAFAPDGKTIATADRTDALRLWAVATGRVVRRLSVEGNVFGSFLFTPDGKQLIAPTRSGVCVCDVATGKEVRRFGGDFSSWVPRLALSADGTLLAGGSWGHGHPQRQTEVRVWDFAAGKELRRLDGHKNGAAQVAFAPDGKTLATADQAHTIRLWAVADGRLRFTLTGHEREITTLTFLPDGKTLVSGAYDRQLVFWDVQTGKEVARRHEPNSTLTLAPDGTRCATAFSVFAPGILDLKTGKRLHDLKGHGGWVKSAAFAPDGRVLATGGDDNTMRLWDAVTGKPIVRGGGHDTYVSAVAFLADNQTVATGSWDGTVRLWDGRTGKQVRAHQQPGVVTSVAFSPDGQLLATAGGATDAVVRLFDVDSGRELRVIRTGDRAAWGLHFAADGKVLASCGYDAVRLWDTATGQEIRRFPADDRNSFAVAMSGSGKTLAVFYKDQKAIVLFDVESGRQRRLPTPHVVGTLAFAPDGKLLAATGGSDDPGVHLWDVATGTRRATLPVPRPDPSGTRRAVAFSPDGKTLATAATSLKSEGIDFWDVETTRLLRRFVGQRGVWALAFSPDGKRLVSGSTDRTAVVWDVTAARGEPR